MAIAAGSLVLIDYTASIKGDGEVFKTTRSADAGKLAGKAAADARYGPQLASVGDKSFPPPAGIEERLAAASPGDEFAVEVPPEKGFGKSDRKKVRTIPLRKLGDDADRTMVGDSVSVDDRKGVIKFKGPGRVDRKSVV